MALARGWSDSVVGSSTLKKQARCCRREGIAAQQRCKRPQMLALGNGGSDGLSYKDAGVDIDAGNELVKRIAKMVVQIRGIAFSPSP